MSYAKRVQVVNRSSNLMCNNLCSILSDFEIPALQIIKEITSFEIFHHNIDVVRVLKNIIKANDIWMLTNFKNFNFSFKKFNIFKTKFFFLDNFNRNFPAWLLMKCSLYEAILSFSQTLFKVIEIMKISISNCLLNLLDPLISLIFGLKVIYSTLIWENEHERVHDSLILHHFFHFTLNKYTSKTLHIFMSLITLVLITVQFLA